MRRFFWIRIALFLRQSRWGFALLALWFALGTILFYRVEHLSLSQAFLNAVYLRVQPGSLWILYSFGASAFCSGSLFPFLFFKRCNVTIPRRDAACSPAK